MVTRLRRKLKILSLNKPIKLIRMKKLTKPINGYESPQVATIHLVTEAVCIAASGSSDSSLDDMTESDGEWAI